MDNKFKEGQTVYENEKYFREGKKQFGKELKRILGVKVDKVIKIHSAPNPYWAYFLTNDMIVNEAFLSGTPYKE